MADTPDPRVSEVIAALEAIRCDQKHPFVVLQAPAEGDGYPNYCQVFADERGYVCETRIFSGNEFRHMRAFSPDAEGRNRSWRSVVEELIEPVAVFPGGLAEWLGTTPPNTRNSPLIAVNATIA